MYSTTLFGTTYYAMGVRRSVGNGKAKKDIVSTYITTCGTTLLADKKTYVEFKSDGRRVEYRIPRNGVEVIYSKGQPACDVFNKLRQSSIALEKAWVPKEWEQRGLQTAWGSLMTDAYLLSQLTPLRDQFKMNDNGLKKFMSRVVKHLLLNPHRSVEMRARCRSFNQLAATKIMRRRATLLDHADGESNSDLENVSPHSQQSSYTALRNKNSKYEFKQRWCVACNSKTSFYCTDCGVDTPCCRASLDARCSSRHSQQPAVDFRPSTPRGTGAGRRKRGREREAADRGGSARQRRML